MIHNLNKGGKEEMVRLRMNDRILIIRDSVKLDMLVYDMETDIRLLYKTVNLNKSDTLSFIYAKYSERLLILLGSKGVESPDTVDIIRNMINDICK